MHAMVLNAVGQPLVWTELPDRRRHLKVCAPDNYKGSWGAPSCMAASTIWHFEGGNMILAFRVAMATALAMPIAVAAQPASRFADTKAVEAVLSQYKAAIEKLDAKGTERLFAADSQIFETGGSEGTCPTRAAGKPRCSGRR